MAWWDTIDWSDPVERDCPLNQGLAGWWMGAPNSFGGIQMQDLCNKNHAVLTNMDPATDWRSTEHGPAIATDGTDDFAGYARSGPPTFPFSLALWVASGESIVSIASTAAVNNRYVSLALNASNNYFYQVRNNGATPGATNFVLISTGTYAGGEAFLVGTSHSATDHRLYVPGVGSVTSTVSSGIDANTLRFGIGALRRSVSPTYSAGTTISAIQWSRSLIEPEAEELANQKRNGFPDMLRHVRRRSMVSVQADVPASARAGDMLLLGVGA